MINKIYKCRNCGKQYTQFNHPKECCGVSLKKKVANNPKIRWIYKELGEK